MSSDGGGSVLALIECIFEMTNIGPNNEISDLMDLIGRNILNCETNPKLCLKLLLKWKEIFMLYSDNTTIETNCKSEVEHVTGNPVIYHCVKEDDMFENNWRGNLIDEINVHITLVCNLLYYLSGETEEGEDELTEFGNLSILSTDVMVNLINWFARTVKNLLSNLRGLSCYPQENGSRGARNRVATVFAERNKLFPLQTRTTMAEHRWSIASALGDSSRTYIWCKCCPARKKQGKRVQCITSQMNDACIVFKIMDQNQYFDSIDAVTWFDSFTLHVKSSVSEKMEADNAINYLWMRFVFTLYEFQHFGLIVMKPQKNRDEIIFKRIVEVWAARLEET
eukprot:CAMPEP_0194367328 /NCGR_PEP_ID=MMETSP0174-20130528/15398_1 /TAXON_ID=216777 /ORGANISM="Proboscia alata, Strain PI-D3" /LENGTH=337 /DNA_ID=CAMNT_0039142999 /DNA_START=2036 /DNA_END=3049 /DNA_ORIENTATION=+